MSKIHTSFDLLDYIQEVKSPEVAAQMAQSAAWRIDVLIIGAARQLYKGVKTKLYEDGVDTMAELTMHLNEAANAEQSFQDNGSSNIGPVTTIKELMYMREGWHNMAKELTSLTFDWQGIPRRYDVKEIAEQIFEPTEFEVAGQTKQRMKISAERRAKAFGMPEATDRLYENNLRRAIQRNTDVSENLKTQAQGVMNMFMLACAYREVEFNGSTEFMSLDTNTQRVLIDAAKTAADRAEQYAMGNRNLSDADFDLISLSALKVNADLTATLKQPRFRAAAAQEQAASSNVG